MLLSVVIPIFNVEKYLHQCIESVLKQNLEDYEIVLVDDGSPDNCPKICDEYASKYEQIKVIHKLNGGLSSARNEGLKHSNGDYIIFIDSDDWWNEKVSVKEMLNIVRHKPQVEMFLFTSLDYIEGEGFFKRKEHDNLNQIKTDSVENYYSSLLANGNLEIHSSTKIIKRNFLLKNNLFFTENIYSEDNEWILRLLRKLDCVEIINKPLYIYRAGRQGSITSTIKEKNILDILNIISESIKYYSNSNENFTIKRFEYCYLSYLWFSALGLSNRLSKVERKQLKPLFKKTKSVCKYSNSKKTKMCYYVYKVFGFNLTRIILGKYLKIKNKYNLNKNKVEI